MQSEADTNAANERNAVFKMLGIQRSLERKNRRLAYIDLVKSGLGARSVDSFAKHSHLTKKQVSQLIHVSERTIQRGAGKKLNINSSEKLLELARLFYKGADVFGSNDRFLEWLNRQNVSLGNQRPLDLLETSLGMEMVMDELLRIEYGVFS